MTKISLDPLNRLELTSPSVLLRSGLPVLNGKPLETSQVQVDEQGENFTIVYTSPDPSSGRFGILVHNPSVPEEPGWMRYWVEGLPEDLALDSFGLHFAVIENGRAFLRQGYQSWDGSYYVGLEGPATTQETTGYAMTQFLPGDGGQTLVLGFDRHDRFQHTFTFHHRSPPELTVESLWDQKDRSDMRRCSSERLLFLARPNAEDGLKAWAEQVAAASPHPPHVQGPRLTGWCSWYNLYAMITEENLLEHLESTARVSRREGLPMRIFQVDDGFTPEMGDWLEVKPQFPRGMKALLEDIRSAGFIPGLWIAPFMVGNRSRLYRDHPDWVVQDRQQGGPLVQYTFYGEFRWHKRSEEYYILDTTHPQAFEYLRQVFHTWREDWGCEYFKTDFMLFGSEHGPRRAVRHTPGMTRMEIWMQVAEMIREEIGNALWLGCGCPLWAPVGLVDAMRISKDVGVRWEGNFPVMERLRDTMTRNFANRILWQSDPDVVLLREQFHHLTQAEARSLALFAGLTLGVLMTSDDLQALSPGRLRLWKLLLNLAPGECCFPLMESSAAAYTHPGAELSTQEAGWDSVLVQALPNQPQPDLDLVFCFNLDEKPARRTYPLSALGLSGPKYTIEWTSGESSEEPAEFLSLLLPPHDGRLFCLSSQPWSSDRIASAIPAWLPEPG